MRGTGGGGFIETKNNACAKHGLHPDLFDQVDGTASKRVAEAAEFAAKSRQPSKEKETR